jgi:DNA-binding FrmR family transcriptional regulator
MAKVQRREATPDGYVGEKRQKEVRARLSRARGQIDGIERMLDSGRPCKDILQQIAAAQEALRAAGKLMVRNYLENCATGAILAGPKSETYDEIMDMIYRMVR